MALRVPCVIHRWPRSRQTATERRKDRPAVPPHLTEVRRCKRELYAASEWEPSTFPFPVHQPTQHPLRACPVAGARVIETNR